MRNFRPPQPSTSRQPDAVANPNDGSDVRGSSARSPTRARGEQLAVTLIRVPPHSGFELGAEPVEMWAVSRRLGRADARKIDGFWAASPNAAQDAG